MNDLSGWHFIRCNDIIAYFQYDRNMRTIIKWAMRKDMSFFEKRIRWIAIDIKTQIEIVAKFNKGNWRASDCDTVPWGDDIETLVALEQA